MRARCPRCFRPADGFHWCGDPASTEPRNRRPRKPSRRYPRTRAEYLATVAAECGTRGAYKRGCRCPPCRAANATYIAARRVAVGRKS